MNSYLGEFINYVNKTYKVIEEPQKTYFQGYFSKSSIVKRLFDEYGDNSSVFEFLKKIDVKIDDINSLEEFGYDNFFNECLFDVNKKNIELYSIKHKTNDYTFSCFMENEKVLRYVMKDKLSSNFFINEIINTADEYIQEDPMFLLMVMYAPSLDESLWSSVIKKLNGEIIDFANVFLMTKSFYQDVERCIGKDSLCRDLILGDKIKKTWNNFIFLYRQLAEEDYDIYVEYLNESFVKDYDKIIQEQNIHKQLSSLIERFVIFIFENKKVDVAVLDFFVPVLMNENFSVLNLFQEKYIKESEIEVIINSGKWQWEKCAIILNFFLNLNFSIYRKYTFLTSILVKTNVDKILDYLNKFKIGNDENALNSPKSPCTFIYSSLLFHSTRTDTRANLFINDQFRIILTHIDLNILKDVFDEWKESLNIEYITNCVKKILSNEDILFSKLKDDKIQSLLFLNRLVELEFVEKTWISKAVDYMDKNNLLYDDNTELNNDQERNQVEKLKDSIYKYLGRIDKKKDNLVGESVIKAIWKEIPQMMDYMWIIKNKDSHHPLIWSDLIALVNKLNVQFELKKPYLNSKKGIILGQILHCSKSFSDQIIFLSQKRIEMANYEKQGVNASIEDCKKDIVVVERKCNELYEEARALYEIMRKKMNETTD